MIRQLIIGAVIAAAFHPGQSAPAEGTAPNTLVCDFRSGHIAAGPASDWRPLRTGDRLTLTFAAINLKKNTAQLITAAGVITVKVLHGGYLVTFLEVTPVGNVNITSVLHDQTRPFAGLSLPAVHSRHAAMTDEMTVSQYVGLCGPNY
jgi:hypothetical protein